MRCTPPIPNRRSHGTASAVSLLCIGARLGIVLAMVGWASLCAAIFCASSVYAHSQVQAALSLAVSPAGSGVWVVASPAGLLRSTDAGKTFAWQCGVAFGSGGKLGLTRRASAHGSGFLLLEDQSLQRAADGCVWGGSVPGLAATDVVLHLSGGDRAGGIGAEVSGNVVWIVVKTNTGTKLMRSTDGASFAAVSLPEGFAARSSAPQWRSGDAALVAGTYNGAAAIVSVTKEGHSPVSKLPAGAELEPLIWLSQDRVPGTKGVWVIRSSSDAAERLWVSTDRGASWQQRFEMPPGDAIAGAAWLPGAATGTLLISGHEARVLRSTDNGASFDKVAGSPHATCLRVINGKLHACTDGIADEAMIMRSDDAGDTWQTVACFGKVTGAASCGSAQPVCADLLKYTLIDAAATPGTCKPVTQVGGDAVSAGDTASGSSGAGAHDTAGDSSGASGGSSSGSSGASGGGGVVTRPPDDGCISTPGGPARSPTILLLLLAMAAVTVVTSRTPSSRRPCRPWPAPPRCAAPARGADPSRTSRTPAPTRAAAGVHSASPPRPHA
jgi:hypothetical protein